MIIEGNVLCNVNYWSWFDTNFTPGNASTQCNASLLSCHRIHVILWFRFALTALFHLHHKLSIPRITYVFNFAQIFNWPFFTLKSNVHSVETEMCVLTFCLFSCSSHRNHNLHISAQWSERTFIQIHKKYVNFRVLKP